MPEITLSDSFVGWIAFAFGLQCWFDIKRCINTIYSRCYV